MKDIYELSQNLALDESVVLFRGRLVIRQHIKNKRYKYGTSLYMLAELGRLTHRILIYSWQGQDMSNDFTRLLIKLMEGLDSCGQSLYMDNYYTSVNPARILLNNGILCTGTLRTNRKRKP